MGLFDTYRSGAHQIIHRDTTRFGGIKDGLREPGVDGSRPLTQVELWKEFAIDRFQSGQDLADLFRCVAYHATERLQFVKAATKLEPHGVWPVEDFFEWDRVATPCCDQAQPKWIIV